MEDEKSLHENDHELSFASNNEASPRRGGEEEDLTAPHVRFNMESPLGTGSPYANRHRTYSEHSRTVLESKISQRNAVLQFQFGFEEADSAISNDNNENHSSFAQRMDPEQVVWQPRGQSFSGSTIGDFLNQSQKEKLIAETEIVQSFFKEMDSVADISAKINYKVNTRLRNVSFFVPMEVTKDGKGSRIQTVWNQSFLYKVLRFFRRLAAVTEYRRQSNIQNRTRTTNGTEDILSPEQPNGSSGGAPTLFPEAEYKRVLSNVSLNLKPGRMYLVLGAPQSGKTTLLKAIAGLLPNTRVIAGKNKGQPRPGSPYIEGSVEYNGLEKTTHDNFFLTNAIAFIDQIERHAPRLTVEETFEFAFQCKSGGTHCPRGLQVSPEQRAAFREMDRKNVLLKFTMDLLGVSHVADTFVGDSDVRGISGGQRRRVTVGEMLQSIPSSAIMCADEVSNGLDSRSTYDIIKVLADLAKLGSRTRVISLLQPSPETFSLFDEVILLAEGHIIYAGPIAQVVNYFEELGYPLPERMDVADYLQTVSTPDGEELFVPQGSTTTHYTAERFAEAFRSSFLGRKIEQQLETPHPYPWVPSEMKKKSVDEEAGLNDNSTKISEIPLTLRIQFRNSFTRSTWLVLKRHFTLWLRDRRFLIANFIKNVVMGLSVGMVFIKPSDPTQIFGALFQSMLFIMLGGMTSAPAQIEERTIYYKHVDANFFQTFAFVWGRFLAMAPQAALDVATFGTFLYWMIGLTPKASYFFIFLAILFIFNLSLNTMFGFFAAVLPDKAGVQGVASVILFLSTLFGGFIVAPSVIPKYYSWLYWWNPFAWAYRSVIVNNFRSYTNSTYVNAPHTGVPPGNYTEGEIILWGWGFRTSDNLPFSDSWVAYGFAYLVPYTLLCALLIGMGLKYVRIDGRKSKTEAIVDDSRVDDSDSFDVPFTPVNLTFDHICYEVPASTGSSTLKLLNNVTGMLKSGRMCALMGSSGAGKTTLMDVLALRKSSGTITGEVRLNGFLQEKNSFRRCAGYVEQFDVQTPELTVCETITFSANLRIDPSSSSIQSDEDISRFVNTIMNMFELTPLKDYQVGTTDTGGLSFEQRKRLSIAVEFAASPSILFLDEPTTGLDSRAAMLVMKSLKRVVETGRTVCATIHQPSSAVFSMFDDLLLLKKGGEVVFHGELGEDSINLVNYFERNGADPMEYGTNPASWMLTVLDDKQKDWAELYRMSEDNRFIENQIGEIKESAVEATMISFKTQYARNGFKRNQLMNDRLKLIYWRSPSYNLARVLISIGISFILASVFITSRYPSEYTELEMQGRLSIIFLSFIIIGVLSMITVLPTTLSIRDVYYRHNLAGMLEHTSLTLGLGVAEKPFLIVMSSLFVIVFYLTLGLTLNLRKFFCFWGFFTFNIAIYSYFGQAFMCLVPGMATAQILCSVFIGINNFFSGLIVRPQYLTGFWSIPFWLTPGHYVFEGLVASQYYQNTTPVIATPGSDFFKYLNCSNDQGSPCVGTVEQYVDVFFGGHFAYKHVLWPDAIALGIFLVLARLLTYWALKRYNFAAN